MFGTTAAVASVVLAVVALIATFTDPGAALLATLVFVGLALVSDMIWSSWIGFALIRSSRAASQLRA